jgi:hypothetical protein
MLVTPLTRLSTDRRVLERLRAEYIEMPGLRLRAVQVQRLCGIEPTVCRTLLDALVDEKFLCANADGTYARLFEG